MNRLTFIRNEETTRQKRGPQARGNPGGLLDCSGVSEDCTAASIVTSLSAPRNDRAGGWHDVSFFSFRADQQTEA
jgi:hypothetical protein